MDWILLLKALLSLVFVLGLLLVSVWGIKYCQMKGKNCGWLKTLQVGQRLNIVEIRRIDGRNSLALIKKDEKEMLLLLNPNHNLLLETTDIKKADK